MLKGSFYLFFVPPQEETGRGKKKKKKSEKTGGRGRPICCDDVIIVYRLTHSISDDNIAVAGLEWFSGVTHFLNDPRDARSAVRI